MSDETTLHRVAAVIAATFSADAASIDAQTTASDIDGWDSVSHAMLVMALEDEFGVELEFGLTMAQPNVGQLSTLVDAQRV